MLTRFKQTLIVYIYDLNAKHISCRDKASKNTESWDSGFRDHRCISTLLLFAKDLTLKTWVQTSAAEQVLGMHLPWSYLTTWLSRHHLGAFGISAQPPWPQATILPICKLCYLQWTFALNLQTNANKTQKQSHIHVMPDIQNMLNKNVLVGFWCNKPKNWSK